MTERILHLPLIRRHTHVPYLWRASCPCGWGAFAPSEQLVRRVAQSHVDEEEPFPIDMISPDPTHGRED